MSESAADLDRKLQSIHAMLHPQSIAIVGATERLQYGGRFLKNLLMTGCKARLYPVNPKRDAIFGVPCYHSIAEIPEPVDLAAMVISAPSVIPALREFVAQGAKSALIISAGFAELGTEEGRARQAELRALARESGVRLCGPNCLGLANVGDGIWPTPSSRVAREAHVERSGIGLVSQSGATCFLPLMAFAQDRGIGFRYVISTGNEADLESSDYVQYLLRDPEVRVVAMLVEGFKDGAKLVETAEMALETGKPIVLLKIGRSEAGRRGASSHTAAMTGSDVVQDALFKQKGIIRVDDYDELLETANMFLKAKAPRGERAGVISESGGMGSFMADKCGEVGLEVPPLSAETREKLLAIMGERGSAANPADLTGFGTGEAFPTVLGLLLAEAQQDFVIMSSVGGEIQAKAVIEATQKSEKPILFVWSGSTRDTGGLPLLKASNVPLFYLPGKGAKGARRLLDYSRRREAILAEQRQGRRVVPAPPGTALDSLRDLVAGAGRQPLTEYDSKRALALFGVSATKEVRCSGGEEAMRAAERIGYPVALKVVSQQIAHKTEAGGVRLGIPDAAALARAIDGVLASVRSRQPEARLDGLLVQQMVSGGIEVILGVSRDVQFGPVLMLGLGGILVEALGAAAWRVCPIGRREAQEMIGEVKGLSRLLAGYRGRPKADAEALVEALVHVSRMALWAKDEIASLDINPLAVLPEGQGAVALDALIVPVS